MQLRHDGNVSSHLILLFLQVPQPRCELRCFRREFLFLLEEKNSCFNWAYCCSCPCSCCCRCSRVFGNTGDLVWCILVTELFGVCVWFNDIFPWLGIWSGCCCVYCDGIIWDTNCSRGGNAGCWIGNDDVTAAKCCCSSTSAGNGCVGCSSLGSWCNWLMLGTPGTNETLCSLSTSGVFECEPGFSVDQDSLMLLIHIHCNLSAM